MEPGDFPRPSGELKWVEQSGRRPYWAFVPGPLPPQLNDGDRARTSSALAAASLAYGKLAGLGHRLPNPELLARPYIRREAILSSRIENTHTSFSELAAYEASGLETPASQTRDVYNYVRALEYGLRNASSGITLDLIRTIHRLLMQGARGERYATPGELRSIQNHIGGDTTEPAEARFVPPPAGDAIDRLMQLADYTSDYLAREESPLVVAAFVHYQFEAIHPFLDGNGRVGRVLIPLLFATLGDMPHPLLYLSDYFERDRGKYYDQLYSVSTQSSWSQWLLYFLGGVREQSEVASRLAGDIVDLGEEWHRRLDEVKASRNAHRLADFVHQNSAVDAKVAQRNIEVSTQTAYNAIRALESVGILQEYAHPGGPQVWVAGELLSLVERAS